MKAKNAKHKHLRKFFIFWELAKIFKSYKFLSFSDQEATTLYSNYVAYKVQLALFDLYISAKNKDITWAEFVLIVRRSEKIRTEAKDVVHHAIANFKFDPSSFQEVCSNEKIFVFHTNDSDDSQISISKLFTRKEANSLIYLFMFHSEISYYSYLSSSRNGYTWTQYLRDLKNDRAMLETLTRAFQRSLAKLDYTKEWLSKNLDESIFVKS